VTGATGFLGRHIVRVLTTRGARVVGVVRNPDRVPELVAQGVELRRADLAEPERLRAGLAGAAALVSNAALLPVRNWSGDAHRRTNVDGTRNVLEAAVACGVPRVVHVSSVSVYRPAGGAALTEDHPLLDDEPRGWFAHPYGHSKAASERLAWRIAGERGLALTTVRPGLIYGAWDSNFMQIFGRLAAFPVTVMPALTWLAMVYAGDVAEAIALALERPAAAGRAYNLAGAPLTVWEFLHAWEEAGGRVGRLVVPIPLPFHQRIDASRARAELGWHDRPVVQALAESFALEAGRSAC
jgi:nucleoside-diphosphate-sugar epimerase